MVEATYLIHYPDSSGEPYSFCIDQSIMVTLIKINITPIAHHGKYAPPELLS